jgi:transcriptional antiterminator RfaH
LVKTLRQWSDRKKKVEIPLISSYVFVNVSEREYYSVLDVPGVVRYVTFEGKAAPIPENQIETLQKAIEGNLNVDMDSKKIKKGELVKIVAGPMRGATGEYIKTVHKSNFIINMSNIGFVLKIEVNAADVVKI